LFETFADIEQYAQNCKFRNCRHEHEPGCAVRQAVAGGSVDNKRLQNFLKLRFELGELRKQQKKR
jgi:ribosome biogenesis GTPase